MELAVLLTQMRSMYNVGSFFRTCDGAGVSRLYLGGYTATPPRKEISKTALGAEEMVPWEQVEDVPALLGRLKGEGFVVVALEKTEESVDLGMWMEAGPLPEKLLCLFGHEKDGVSPELLALCNQVVHLPMLGTKESLNVAVAGGAALYALRLKHCRESAS